MQDSDKSFSLRWETYQNQHTNLRSKCCRSCDILHTKLGMVPNHPKKTHCHSFLFLFNETKHSLFMLVNLVHYLLFPLVQHWDHSEPLSSKDFPFRQRLSEKNRVDLSFPNRRDPRRCSKTRGLQRWANKKGANHMENHHGIYFIEIPPNKFSTISRKVQNLHKQIYYFNSTNYC